MSAVFTLTRYEIGLHDGTRVIVDGEIDFSRIDFRKMSRLTVIGENMLPVAEFAEWVFWRVVPGEPAKQ